ncbi:nucleoside triphosphate pyrophosphatase [Sporichthya brevicatena]|uniref:Maf family protein n=1 Tax=Sporichthya brevicatena TaxID=171442 RepID=UPI0031CDE10B
MPHLILASASPARLTTLRRAGLNPEVIVSDVDETAVFGPTPAATAELLATMKAEAVVGRIEPVPGTVVLGCDSLLELDGQALGKPETTEAATERWRAMRGRTGVLHTGHCLMEPATGRRAVATASTTVRFADVTDAEIGAYVATGEPLRVAGAFTIDGRGGAFVEGIEGDHHNVVGVSLPLLRRLCAALGIAWTALWELPA